MKYMISVLSIVFVFHILNKPVDFYFFKCPSEGNWNIRAMVHCNSTSKYFCLYNNVKDIYVEGCYGPDWDRKGSKRIYSGSFTRGNCSQNRYQPFLFWTNGSSDCFYAKSVCSEEGQLMYKNYSTKDDIACICDYTRNYSFIKNPQNLCYCIPTEEDCSCYIKQCLENNTLPADNGCKGSGYQEGTTCREINKTRELSESGEQVTMEIVRLLSSETTFKTNRNLASAAIVFTMIYVLVVVLLVTLTIDVRKSPKRYHKVTYHRGIERKTCNLSSEEINYLLSVRLLFKVARPSVRKIFDNLIKPKELRNRLDELKGVLEKQYRNTQKCINDVQWDILYKPIKGKTVTSQDFDIGLMIYILLSNYEISDLYEDQFARSITAIFSKIIHMRKEIARRFIRQLSKSKFKQYQDDISQLLSKHEVQETIKCSCICEIGHIENGQEETRQIDCFDVKCIPKSKDSQMQKEIRVPTIEENYFLVVFYVIASTVYPVIQNAYNTCLQPEKNCAEQHTTHRSEEDDSKNLYIRLMIDYLIQRPEVKEHSSFIVLKDIQREIVQSCTGVLTETRFHEILKLIQEAVLHLGGTFSNETLSELQQIKNILE